MRSWMRRKGAISMSRAEEKAILFSCTAPTRQQEERFRSWLTRRYGEDLSLVWQKDGSLQDGFRLQVGSEIYDWSREGRLRQLKESLRQLPKTECSPVTLLKDTISGWSPDALPEEVGTVLSVGDGIATISGLERAAYGEILVFESGIKGMVQNLSHDSVGCIVFGDDQSVSSGSIVRRTGRTAGVPVGEEFLGRVVDALGTPVDGKGPIRAEEYRPVESPAPGIVDRKPVHRPMETGILTIDSMFPIGRGQRELIIGDRQTGKTAIALDAILNQKGKDVVCIYVAIGQKASSVAQLVATLRRYGAMEYSIVVNTSASDPASLQYIAPYAGCAMGEYFMERGRDVLIVYDDLSKHAIAYRALSLLLERAPGREAYPGDVFYLHSRLLERAAQLSDARGGGSMTALPIVETQAGDVSAYIPTNIISITDGQIFLESDLFYAGQRPAVNVGLSVSRVGGHAQTRAMKTAAGAIRLELAQYREIEVFSQFSSDLDETTQHQIAYGKSLLQMLRQPQHRPLQQHQQVILLVSMLSHVAWHIPIGQIGEFCGKLLTHFEETQPALCSDIDRTGQLSAQSRELIVRIASAFVEKEYA